MVRRLVSSSFVLLLVCCWLARTTTACAHAAQTKTTTTTRRGLANATTTTSTTSIITTPLLTDGSMTAEMAILNNDRLQVNVTYQGQSYVALAFSLDDQMPDSIAVIGTPSDGMVQKYNMSGRVTPTVLPDAQQTLEDVSISYDGVVTTMQFTKLLKETNEPEIYMDQNNFFLYAHGTDGLTYLHLHDKWGAVTVNLGSTTTTTTTTTTNTKTTTPAATPSTTNQPTKSSTSTMGSNTADLGNGRMQLEVPLLTDGSFTSTIITDSTQETIEFTVVYQGQSYVAIAFSLDALMPDSIAVIGTLSDGVVEKYTMDGRVTPTRMQNSQQTLTNVSINYDGVVTTMKFTKRLKESNEPEIFLDQNNFFLYAHGTDGMTNLHLHDKRGDVKVNFATGVSASADPNENKTLWAIHGICLAVAWLVLLPIGIACSVGRALFPTSSKTGLWFEWHRGLNMLGVILTIVGFAISVYLIQKEQGDTAEHFSTIQHHKIGLAVFIASVVNAVWGIFRPHAPIVVSTVSVAKAVKKNEHDEEEVTDYDAVTATTTTNGKSANTVAAHSGKTGARILFEFGHRVIGIMAIVLAWFNVSSGAELFSQKYDGTTDLSTVVWIVVAIVAIITLGLGVAGRIKANKSS